MARPGLLGNDLAVQDQLPLAKVADSFGDIDQLHAVAFGCVNHARIGGEHAGATGFRIAGDVAHGQNSAANPVAAFHHLHIETLRFQHQGSVQAGQPGAHHDHVGTVLGAQRPG